METGGLTPFQLKYGTQDADFFKLPKNALPEDCPAKMLKQLDMDLKNLRQTSLNFQKKLIRQRGAEKQITIPYQPNDLILWNPREHSRAHKSEKLMPNWLGPFRVVQQNGNDIECIHLCMGSKWFFHNDRVKPYTDSEEQGLIDSKYDFNQFLIVKINYFIGNPHLRTSMQLSITFDVNGQEQTSIVNYNPDVAETQQFVQYVQSVNYLYPLQFAASIAKQQISVINKSAIKDLKIDDTVWLNLRFFDGIDRAWFDSINFDDKDKVYVVQTVVRKVHNRSRPKAVIYSSLFHQEYELTTYDILACTFSDALKKQNSSHFLEVNSSLCKKYPQLLE